MHVSRQKQKARRWAAETGADRRIRKPWLAAGHAGRGGLADGLAGAERLPDREARLDRNRAGLGSQPAWSGAFGVIPAAFGPHAAS